MPRPCFRLPLRLRVEGTDNSGVRVPELNADAAVEITRDAHTGLELRRPVTGVEAKVDLD